jgi:hypothetical protein
VQKGSYVVQPSTGDISIPASDGKTWTDFFTVKNIAQTDAANIFTVAQAIQATVPTLKFIDSDSATVQAWLSLDGNTVTIKQFDGDGLEVKRGVTINIQAPDDSFDIGSDGTLTLGKYLQNSVTAGITAGTTQTQAGATALVQTVNQVSVCANGNDGVKLPAAVAGREILVINNGAQNLQIWPGSGDAIDGGAADAVDTNVLAAGATRRYTAYDATNWETT